LPARSGPGSTLIPFEKRAPYEDEIAQTFADFMKRAGF